MSKGGIAAIPFHAARTRAGRLLGLDAYFWPSLEKRYRVVLLVQPGDRLEAEPPPGACRLPVRVEVEEALREISRVASIEARPVRGPRLGLGERLAMLLAPWLVAARLRHEKVSVPEEAQARGLAKLILEEEPRPLSRLLWLPARLAGGALEPLDSHIARIYAALHDRDEGYRRAVREAAEKCRADR